METKSKLFGIVLSVVAAMTITTNASAAQQPQEQQKKVKGLVIDRIEPTDWFVGMKNPSLQLMVYGKNIASVQNVTTDYAGVRIDSLVRLGSPNYLLVYLNLSGAQPGTMTLNFDKQKVSYQL